MKSQTTVAVGGEYFTINKIAQNPHLLNKSFVWRLLNKKRYDLGKSLLKTYDIYFLWVSVGAATVS